MIKTNKKGLSKWIWFVIIAVALVIVARLVGLW